MVMSMPDYVLAMQLQAHQAVLKHMATAQAGTVTIVRTLLFHLTGHKGETQWIIRRSCQQSEICRVRLLTRKMDVWKCLKQLSSSTPRSNCTLHILPTAQFDGSWPTASCEPYALLYVAIPETRWPLAYRHSLS